MRKPSRIPPAPFWAALFYLLSSLVQFVDHHIPVPEPVLVVHPAASPGVAKRSRLPRRKAPTQREGAGAACGPTRAG